MTEHHPHLKDIGNSIACLICLKTLDVDADEIYTEKDSFAHANCAAMAKDFIAELAEEIVEIIL